MTNNKQNHSETGTIRLASSLDLIGIVGTYIQLLAYEQIYGSNSNWRLNLYPTKETAHESISKGEMYVMECCEKICGSMVLNSTQAAEYTDIHWKHASVPQKVLVVHTLCISPDEVGKGHATNMLEFAKTYAKEHGFNVIRIDAYADNKPAINLYIKNGFTVAGHGDIVLHGLIHEPQIYLEYLVRD